MNKQVALACVMSGLCLFQSTGQAQQDTDLTRPTPQTAVTSSYTIEFVDIVGNSRTRKGVILNYINLKRGDVIDVEDPSLDLIRWRLLGTGWFEDVRLSLKKGIERGWVILVVEVKERNTIVIDHVTLGVAEGVRSTRDTKTDLEPYLGLAVTDRNVLGTGTALSIATVVSSPQQGLRLGVQREHTLGSPYAFRLFGQFNNGREFFGGDNTMVSIRCPTPDPKDKDPSPCPPEVLAKNAVVRYRRYILGLGTGRDLGPNTHIALDWQGELIDVLIRPDAASERRGTGTEPIDFAINYDLSRLSTLRMSISHDERDDPSFTQKGFWASLSGDLGSAVIGSQYEFLRLQTQLRRWFPLWSGHTLRLSAFGGAIFGRAPFFLKFYASDLSDLIPSRMLELNLDRRPPPNLFRAFGSQGTSIAEMRSEELAARIDAEYTAPLYRGGRSLRAMYTYLNVGLYGLADPRDLRIGIPGYSGLSAIPVDLTFDLGLRLDTEVGVFQIGFSTLLGFITL